jgi:hypothetical protein
MISSPMRFSKMDKEIIDFHEVGSIHQPGIVMAIKNPRMIN